MFPVIDHLDDVLPHVSHETGIVHADRGSYSVVNYVIALEDTFSNALRRECRGLKFDREGRLIARPLHKFFNLGEVRPPEAENWEAPHHVLDKLDGSMVHPAKVDGEMLFMTRFGTSDQSCAAAAIASAGVFALSRDLLDAGMTPVFEYTAPDNQIVLPYETAQLTLLAVRETRTGTYLPRAELEAQAARHDVALVGHLGSVEDPARFIAEARALTGLEGYVIAFEDGHRVKLKADAYVLRHKAMSDVTQEKNLVAWIAADEFDDVLPLLVGETRDAAMSYRDAVMAGVLARAAEVETYVAAHGHLDRKDFAARVMSDIDPRLRPAVFRHLDGKPARDMVMDVLASAAGSNPKVDAVRHLFGMAWEGVALPL